MVQAQAVFKLLVLAVLLVAVKAVYPPCEVFDMTETCDLPVALDVAINPALDAPGDEVFVKWCALSTETGRNISGRFFTPPENPTGGPKAVMASDWKVVIVGITLKNNELRFRINPSAFVKVDPTHAGMSAIVTTSGQENFFTSAFPGALAVKNVPPGFIFDCEWRMEYLTVDSTGTGWRVAPADPSVNDHCGAGAFNLPVQGGRTTDGGLTTIGLQGACGWVQWGGCTDLGANFLFEGQYRIPINRYINIDPTSSNADANNAVIAIAKAQLDPTDIVTGVTWVIPAWQN